MTEKVHVVYEDVVVQHNNCLDLLVTYHIKLEFHIKIFL